MLFGSVARHVVFGVGHRRGAHRSISLEDRDHEFALFGVGIKVNDDSARESAGRLDFYDLFAGSTTNAEPHALSTSGTPFRSTTSPGRCAADGTTTFNRDRRGAREAMCVSANS